MSFFNVLKVLSYIPLRIVFPTKIIGKEKYFKEKAVVCVNHYSSYDVLVLASRLLWGKCRCVGKEELFTSKFSAWFLTKCGAISIKRGESDMAAYKKIVSVLKEDHQLIIFPEGTRNLAGTPEMLPFQVGAASFAMKGNAPIIPIVYHKPLKPFRKNYMMIGDTISLDDFKDLPSHEAREKATEYLYKQMSELKSELSDIVESKKGKKNNK